MKGRDSKKRELSNRSKKPSTYRRVVTEHVNGRSVVQAQGCDPRRSVARTIKERLLMFGDVFTKRTIREANARAAG